MREGVFFIVGLLIGLWRGSHRGWLWAEEFYRGTRS